MGPGLASGALRYARDVGAEAVQVFVSNPRGWAPAPGDPGQDERFRAGCALGRLRVFVHAPYLVNFGTATPSTLHRSVTAVRHALRRGAQIGAEGVVVHAGSAVAGRAEEALQQVRDRLLPLLEEIPDGGPRLLVEPTAGGGQALAARVPALAPYFAALDHHPRLGVCLDTCHLYAAGHDIAAPGGVRTTFTALVATVGRGRLGLVHANDSKDPLGSGRDRHERIGAGSIGLDPFAELFRHPATPGVPVIVETPGGAEVHRADIALLKSLRGR